MSDSWADEEESPKIVDDTKSEAPDEAAAPAESSPVETGPPVDDAGAAKAKEEYPPGVVPAGQPANDIVEVGPAGGIWLKVAPPHQELEIIGAVVTDEYSEFTENQATRLRDAAIAQGVTLIGKSDEEEADGEAVS